MVERNEFHLFGNELEETRVLIVSQSTTYDGLSSFERVSYEVQQFVRPSAKNEETVDKKEYYSEKESFNGHLKCEKIFYKDYQYKRKIPESETSDSEKKTSWESNGTMPKTDSMKDGNNNELSSNEGVSLSSFIQQRKDKKFSYTEWKGNVQKNISGWNFLDTNESDAIYNQISIDGLGHKILAKAEIDRIERDLGDLESKVDFIEAAVQNLEQHIRRNWLVLHGVFEKEKEDTLQVMINVVKERTGLQINPQDVDNCHRMGRRRYRNKADPSKMQLNKRPIVIKFVNYCKRKDLWDHKKHLRGSGLLLTESLTTQRLELLQTAREMFGEKSVWSQDGRIMYRRPDGSKVRINNSDDLKLISGTA